MPEIKRTKFLYKLRRSIGINRSTFNHRVDLGWPLDRVFFEPVNRYRKYPARPRRVFVKQKSKLDRIYDSILSEQQELNIAAVDAYFNIEVGEGSDELDVMGAMAQDRKRIFKMMYKR